jgi:hypothetical protein
LKDHLERAYGRDAHDRNWRILENLFSQLGYRDYLGALERFRAEHPLEIELLSMSAYLIDYPFAGRLFPSALKVLRRLKGLGPTVILSDGDVVFQPRKVERAGLSDAVDGRVLIFHKEEALDDVERRFPASWRRLRASAGLRTVFAWQGSYARDAQTVGALPPADVMIEHIGDLLSFDLSRLRPAPPMPASKLEPAQ